MAYIQLVENTVTGEVRAVPYPGFYKSTPYLVSGIPKNDFVIGMDVDAEHIIEVFVSGRMQNETENYTIDIANNKIITVVPVQVGNSVVIKVYLK